MKILKNKDQELRTFQIIEHVPIPSSGREVNEHMGATFESLVEHCEFRRKGEENYPCCKDCPGYVTPPWEKYHTCFGRKAIDGKYHLYIREV